MTRIDFHTNISDKVVYACRLARKAYGARGKLVLLAEDAAQAAALNAGLWTVGETDFLPHAMAGEALAAQSPIIVTDSLEGEFPHYDMLVNLTRATPPAIDRFQRVFEIISTDEDDAAAGRKRYSAYKQQAYPLTHFVAT
jgi:DNA polymerase-3 subunit chi